MMTEQQSERFNREAMASLNTLLNMPLIATIEEKDMREFMAEAGGRDPKSFHVRNMVWNSTPKSKRNEVTKLRADGLIPGSPEAIAAMRAYVSKQTIPVEDEDAIEYDGIDLGSGKPQCEIDAEIEEMAEVAELVKGNVNLFCKVDD